MKSFSLHTGEVSLEVTEQCGHLYPVNFRFKDKVISPLHSSPWYNETKDYEIPPMLNMLRGDFFCAPFSSSDMLPDETRPHGASANDFWQLLDKKENTISLQLSKDIMGASLIKNISLIPGHHAVYQEHLFNGGTGSLPLGHHLMLRADSPLHLSFSPFNFGETPPGPVEPDFSLGRSLLKYPQHFYSLNHVILNDSTESDLSIYPALQNHEDLLLLKSDEDLSFAWSAASAPAAGWVWFALKNPRILNSTVLWFSNGGRYYPPFSSRHKNVIGIEEVTSYFHLGHRASVQHNHLSAAGIRTALRLNPETPLSVRYIFGLAAIPPDFGKVISIDDITSGILITGSNGGKTEVPLNVDFIKTNYLENK